MVIPRKQNGADELEGILLLLMVGVGGYYIFNATKAIPTPSLPDWMKDPSSAIRGMAPLKNLDVNYNFTIPGTGQTVAELLKLGYTQADINQMMADANAQYGTPIQSTSSVAPPPLSPSGPWWDVWNIWSN